ncbi:GbsR/MarR family transcriptional regulator [Rariglobus hedericola]|uniref:HTH-type transcriptional regulator n=1 Tax=Rariglobus hedericola TaxID=2597822 RepID=A0A556QJ45_9BACT|nr:transcriptional regulator [Rariglobus hedericola]TSJ76673.1 transcriptional regulator [Rariglobus hedericola]
MPAKSTPPVVTVAGQSAELDREIIAFWVQVAGLLGYSRSIGEIFGLIFLSELPLCADEVVERLGISRSGAGQGLKALQDIGAIKPVHPLSSRKEHYQMQTDLGVLVKLLLNARILPKVEELANQRAALDASVRAQGPAHLVQRFEKLDRWRNKTAPLLALLKTFST